MTARAWAKNCLFEHNTDLAVAWRLHPTFSFVGENLWIGYPPSLFSVTTAIESWVDEKKYYDYNRKMCTKVCGHYTQVCTLMLFQLRAVMEEEVLHLFSSQTNQIN